MPRATLPPGFVVPPGGKMLGINLDALRPATVRTIPPAPVSSPDAGLPAERRSRYEVAIDDWIPLLLNRMTRGKLRDWIAQARISHEIVGRACRVAGVAPAWGRRRVSLVVRLNPRRRPFDVDAPWKALLDGLVGCGALRDDSCRWCELGPIDLRTNQPADHTTIILEDVGDSQP